MHQQRWKTWQTPGFVAPMLQSHHQVFDRHDETWLHRRVRDRRWPSVRQSGRQPDRPPQQMRRHLATIRCAHQRHREMDQQFVAIASVRVSVAQECFAALCISRLCFGKVLRSRAMTLVLHYGQHLRSVHQNYKHRHQNTRAKHELAKHNLTLCRFGLSSFQKLICVRSFLPPFFLQLCRVDYLRRYHGPRGGSTKTLGRQDSRFLLLSERHTHSQQTTNNRWVELSTENIFFWMEAEC